MRWTTRTTTVALGLVVMAVAALAAYVTYESRQGNPLADRSYAKAAFQDVGALRVGNDVRMNQRRVGRVASIELAGAHAVVTMEFLGEQPIYENGSAGILSRSGLGQVYLDVRPGDARAGRLHEHEVLPVERTKSYTQLLDLVSELDAPTREAAASTLRELGSGAVGRGRDLQHLFSRAPKLLSDLGAVSTSLAVNSGSDLTSMLSSLDRLSSRFEGREKQISALVGQLRTTFDAIAVDNAYALKASLNAAPATQRDLRRALSELDQPLADTGSAMHTLASGSRSLGNATSDLRGVLRESADPLGKLDTFSESAKPAMEDLTNVVRDARPIAPRVTRAVESAQTPLTVLAPYAPEIAKWFSYATNALSDGDAAGHWLRFTLVHATDSVSGNAPVKDPLTNSDPYPEPGEAPKQRGPQGPLGSAGKPLDGGGR